MGLIGVEISVPPEPCTKEAYEEGCECVLLDHEGSNWLGQPQVCVVVKECPVHDWMRK